MNVGDRFVDPDDPTRECVVIWSGGPLQRPYGPGFCHSSLHPDVIAQAGALRVGPLRAPRQAVSDGTFYGFKGVVS